MKTKGLMCTFRLLAYTYFASNILEAVPFTRNLIHVGQYYNQRIREIQLLRIVRETKINQTLYFLKLAKYTSPELRK